MTDEHSTEVQQEQFDHNEDRFPTWDRLLTRLLEADVVPEGQVSRLVVDCGAGGDITYRWLTARADETDFSYLGPPTDQAG